MTVNQRHYYRILDSVALDYRALPASGMAEKRPEDFFELTTEFALLSALNAVDQEHAAFARILHERDRELAGYLRGINRKIELIAHAIALGSQNVSEQHRYEVSLSEGGLAFDCPETFAPGSLLAVRLTLLPRLTTIVTFARVVASEDHPARPFSLSVEFVDLDESQRQMLARHIMRSQSQLQRNRKDD
jgi:hypothetical protein